MAAEPEPADDSSGRGRGRDGRWGAGVDDRGSLGAGSRPGGDVRAPVSSGTAHQPATDVAIDELDSLFDIEAPSSMVLATAGQPTACGRPPRPRPPTEAEAPPRDRRCCPERTATSAATDEARGAEPAAAPPEPQDEPEAEAEAAPHTQPDVEPEAGEPGGARGRRRPRRPPRPRRGRSAAAPRTSRRRTWPSTRSTRSSTSEGTAPYAAADGQDPPAHRAGGSSRAAHPPWRGRCRSADESATGCRSQKVALAPLVRRGGVGAGPPVSQPPGVGPRRWPSHRSSAVAGSVPAFRR